MLHTQDRAAEAEATRKFERRRKDRVKEGKRWSEERDQLLADEGEEQRREDDLAEENARVKEEEAKQHRRERDEKRRREAVKVEEV